MADWGFRFTPDDRSLLPSLVQKLTDAIQAPPDDEDDESAHWETRSSYFDTTIAPVLRTMKFTGEVLSDGEASGESIQEWTYEAGERTSIYTVED